MEQPSTSSDWQVRESDSASLEAALADLRQGASRLVALPLAERMALIQRCMDDTAAVATDWVRDSCRAKGIAPDSPQAGEEWLAGPMCVMRYFRLLRDSLDQLEQRGAPRLPGRVRSGSGGRAVAPVFPSSIMDALLYTGIRAEVWMRPGVTPENLPDSVATAYRGQPATPGICLVLGAGNVSSIPPTDVLSRMFEANRAVLLKMHPVNAYLGPHFELALAGLIEAGFLRIVYGGAEAGQRAIAHPEVGEVHITGSIHTHDTIVWGADKKEQARRKARGEPLLGKPITSELGNVSPVIVVPGRYSGRALRFQAENVAAMLTNNASFNCNAAKMLLTWRDWPQREAFLAEIRAVLARVPPRKAYYPGAEERYARFTASPPGERLGAPGEGELPWTLLPGLAPDPESIHFREEAFCGVLGESPLEAADAEDFLERATTFANESMWGTLNACLILPSAFRKTPRGRAALQSALEALRYGTIGINIWPAVGYALMSPPWGGWQGEGIGLENVQSGLGWVHNTYLLEGAEKVVVEGPLTAFPKPAWFPGHRTGHLLGPRLVRFEHSPSWGKLPGIVMTALRG